MVRKKLLTLLSAIGLLACGACFLPPPRPIQPPSPRIEARGIESVFVEVTNTAGTPNIDTSEFAQSLASSINTLDHGRHPRAYLGAQQKAGDPVFHVSILNEGAASEPIAQAPESRWTLTVSITATLTAANGAILWQESNRQFHMSRSLLVSTPELAWHAPDITTWLHAVAHYLATDMLYGDQ